jgi:hypothetical protein
MSNYEKGFADAIAQSEGFAKNPLYKKSLKKIPQKHHLEFTKKINYFLMLKNGNVLESIDLARKFMRDTHGLF